MYINCAGEFLKVYFVIVCWNNARLLEECLDSIHLQTYNNYSVIVVDNGSTDNSVGLISEKYPNVKLIDNGQNDGFAIGNNVGIQEAMIDTQCQYIALLNTDARLEKNWLSTLVQFAEAHKKGASFQTPTADYYNHLVLDSRGITINHQGSAVQLGYRQTNFAQLKTQKVFGVNAAAALYSRKFLETQPFGKDYFDSDLWMYLEDVDLAARATMMGWENWYVNMSMAYHMGSASSGKNPGFSVYMIYRNNLPVLIKNFPLILVCMLFPGMIFADIKILHKLWRSKNYVTIRSMIRGRVHSVPMAFKFIAKRRKLKSMSVISLVSLWRLMEPVEIFK
jgi:GT2 family glycosyltransferase